MSTKNENDNFQENENDNENDNENFEDFVCPLCGGEGILDEVLDIKCNVCKGKGTINNDERETYEL